MKHQVWEVVLENVDTGHSVTLEVSTESRLAQTDAEAKAIKRFPGENIRCLTSKFSRDSLFEWLAPSERIRFEIMWLAQRGNITKEEWRGILCNSYERELLIPALDNEALASATEYVLKNGSVNERPFVTYNEAMVGMYGPELLKRFVALIAEKTEKK